MGLSNKREEQIKQMPRIESGFTKSRDGRYLIHKTTITTIRPTAYFEKVIAEEGTASTEEVAENLVSELLSVR